MLEGVAGFTLGVCCVDEGRQFEMQPGLEGDLQLYRSRAEQCRWSLCVVLYRPVC